MSRLLGAVSLAAAMGAAVAAAGVGLEANRNVHTARPATSEAAQSARVIVKFKEGASASIQSARTSAAGASTGPRAAAAMSARLGLRLSDGRALGERTQVLLASGTSSSVLAQRLARESDIEWAVPDRVQYIQTAPNDPLYPAGQTATTPAVGQWYLRAPDATVKSGIDIEAAWAITTNPDSATAAPGSAVVVADVDTGITVHPDLQAKIFYSGTTPYGYDFIGYSQTGVLDKSEAQATANDGNLADADPSDPGDWVSSSDVSSGKLGSGCTSDAIGDSSWHGTQTAGIIGAQTNNGIGMAGTGYNTMVVPVRALGKCGGYESDIIAAIQWAGGIAMSGTPTNLHPAKVINLSLGGDSDCDSAYQDALTALRNKGVVVVAAAGNGTFDSSSGDTVGSAVFVPADCKPKASDSDQTPIVVAVGALRHAGTKVGFSNLGPEVTISAPGGNCVNTTPGSACLYPILTTANTGKTGPESATYSTSFGEVSLGTSFSTPMVAGTIALMKAAAPNLTNQQIIATLRSTARPFPTTSDTGISNQCTAPVAPGADRSTTAHEGECLCTTTTCGAGMLDAGAAVAQAAAQARTSAIVIGADAVTVGSTATLAGDHSIATPGATITGYQWSVTSGGAAATLSASSGPSVVLTGVANGTAVVQLTVTDSTGASASTTDSVVVSGGSSGGGGSSSGGGGGAANPLWLAALALAGLLLGPRRRAGK